MAPQTTTNLQERAATKAIAQPAGAKTVAEFFAGIGLMRMGLERRGWRVVFANDMDEQKLAMYEGHFGEAGNYYDTRDIHTLPPEEVPSVALATASFPCNDLSLAGGREGLAGRQSSAFWGFRDILSGMGGRRPPLVLLENVVGFLTSHKGADLRAVLEALSGLGYSVDIFILDAARFVPQSRARFFVVGKQEPTPSNTEPQNLASPSTVRPGPVCEFIFLNQDLRWDIRELPDPPTCGCKLRDIVEDLPDDAPEWWSRKRTDYLYSQMSDRHLAIANEMIRGERWSYGGVFRRVRKGRSMAELRTDGLAGCLRTPRGGSGRQILFKAGFGRYAVRLMTPRECARLMGADDYRITASSNQALFGFGDAVCVPAIEWIAENYLDPLHTSLAQAQRESDPSRDVIPTASASPRRGGI